MDSSPAFLYGYQVAAIHALGPAFSASLRAASIAAVAVSFAWKRLDLGEYIKNQMDESTFIEDNYVDPAQVDIEGKTDKSVNVKIIKLSEAQNSCCSIDNITVTEGTIVPTAEKAHKIEFIGDSMTCGYGVEDSDLTHNFSTASENCCKAFGVKTAKLLDADYSLVCYSGYGIVSGYSADGSKNTDDLVADYYEKYCYTAADGFDGIKPQTIAYDHGF